MIQVQELRYNIPPVVTESLCAKDDKVGAGGHLAGITSSCWNKLLGRLNHLGLLEQAFAMPKPLLGYLNKLLERQKHLGLLEKDSETLYDGHLGLFEPASGTPRPPWVARSFVDAAVTSGRLNELLRRQNQSGLPKQASETRKPHRFAGTRFWDAGIKSGCWNKLLGRCGHLGLVEQASGSPKSNRIAGISFWDSVVTLGCLSKLLGCRNQIGMLKQASRTPKHRYLYGAAENINLEDIMKA